MSNEIEEFVKKCHGCQVSQKSDGQATVPSPSLPIPSKPWQRLAIDITGPFATAPNHKRFIVVLIDHHSGYPEYKLLGNVDSASIIHWLEEVFSRYGYPSELLSDNGPQFVSHEFEIYLSKNGVRHLRSPVYNPQTNGRLECFNRYLKFGAQTFQQGNRWEDEVQKLFRSYRAISLSDAGKSPAELIHGWKMRLPFEPPSIQCDGDEISIDEKLMRN